MGTTSAYSYKTILLKGAEHCIRDEYDAGEAGIYPGMFLELASDGDVELQDESETIGPGLIAIEDSLQGSEVDTAYTSGYVVLCAWLQPGCEFWGWLAPGHNASVGSYLTFAGYESAGALGVAQQTSAQLGAGVVAIAKEAVNNSSGSAATRCLMQWIR